MGLAKTGSRFDLAERRPALDGQHRLYGALAHLWPLMSPPNHYEDEARYWLGELRSRLAQGKRCILDLGTGGGHHLHHLTAEFDATAVDMSEAMLSHSLRLNPRVAYHIGDMRTVRLGETFDAVLVHDSISYMTTEADLLSVFATARAHLRPGGLLIAAPDDHTDTFDPPRVEYQTNTDGDTELTYVEYSTDLDPNDTTIETTYVFFIKRGGELRVEVDNHKKGLFPMATWERLLTEAGFEVDQVDYPVSEDGRGMWLWVGRVVGGWRFLLPVGTEKGSGVLARGEELIEKYLRLSVRDCWFRSQIASDGRRVVSETLVHERRQVGRNYDSGLKYQLRDDDFPVIATEAVFVLWL